MKNIYKTNLINLFRRNNQSLMAVLFIGLLIRILFSFYFSKYYFGQVKYTFGDTWSYTQSFLNLLEYGVYTFDVNSMDAYLYRGPIYPFFWGLHYIIFGDSYVFEMVALSQCFIDTASGYIIYKILLRFGLSVKWALLGAALFLFNPLLLVHVPISGTETISTLLVLLVIYLALTANSGTKWFVVGGLCAIAVMARQYLGLLLPIALVYSLLSNKFSNYRDAIKTILIITLGFSIVISPWFLRNWINHDTPTFLMGKTSGYPAYQSDYASFQRLYTLFQIDITPTYKSVAKHGSDDVSDKSIFEPFQKEVERANFLAYKCGPSFMVWRGDSSQMKMKNDMGCRDDVVSAYESLRVKFIEEKGFIFYIQIPLQNIKKAIFKSDLTISRDGWMGVAIKSIFNFRTMVVLMALLAIFILPTRKELIFMFFPLGLILYISFVTRQVEMRYLAQADAVLILYAMYSVSSMFSAFGKVARRM